MLSNMDELLKTKIVEEKECEQMKKVRYSVLVGSLLYLSCHTRPDISFAVGVLARIVESPSLMHWKAGKLVLRYLVGTSRRGVVVGSEGNTSGIPDYLRIATVTRLEMFRTGNKQVHILYC